MTDLLDGHPIPARSDSLGSHRHPTERIVWARRLVATLIVLVPVGWALGRSTPSGTDLVNRRGLPVLGDLFASAIHPSLEPDFLLLTLKAAGITLAFAMLGTAGALLIGLAGGLVLSDIAWSRQPVPVRVVRFLLRGILVAVRSIHELVWALLLVSVLGLDPLVAVLAIALPFGAQTAQVFGHTLDGIPHGPFRSLRTSGVATMPALTYAILPGAGPLLLSYSFYRFECAIRSSVLLGIVGIGGLGQTLGVSLQSRNWNEVWTLVGAIFLLSALVDLWSTRVRADMAVVTCSDWSSGQRWQRDRNPPQARRMQRRSTSRWARGSVVVLLPALVIAWLASGVSLAGLASARTSDLAMRLIRDLWPPQLPRQGWALVAEATLDTVAMAILAMAVAVAITVTLGPFATVPRRGRAGAVRWLQGSSWWLARALLLLLRSVPPTVWAVVTLLVLFPGILPGALALGLYTGGILARLVAEAWESIDTRAKDALRHAGVSSGLSAAAATLPPSTQQLLTYTLYRFEICIRDTAVVGVVGAAGLGRLLAENLATFRFPVVTTLLLTSCLLSMTTEIVARRLRRAVRP